MLFLAELDEGVHGEECFTGGDLSLDEIEVPLSEGLGVVDGEVPREDLVFD